MSEHRRATRHQVSIAAKLTVEGQAMEGTIRNLSLGGVLVGDVGRQPLGQRVHIAFSVPAPLHEIAVGAVVRWTDSEGVGLQFEGLRARDVWALNEYFKRLP